ncbi:MAG: nucleotidyl transferase AbiEii/AbiGii toxin family protein [Actinobacteria bacterium]|nr:nucleotidyl transferase AbiEii/AbiGii toxin family protein [Actinomycetota bacterium]
MLYALEGFLRRLAASDDRDAFVLKGGVLLAAFDARRPTRDADLLALDLDNDRANVEAKIGSIASIDVADGLALDVASVTSEVIRNEDEYSGIRVKLNYALATMYVRIGIDVNVGDPVHPMPQRITVPGLLADDVTLLGYPMAAVIAEKAVTAMQRGAANTRWRDWADIHVLSARHAFDSDELAGACNAVAAHRGTEVVLIAALLPDYPGIAQAKWVAWRRRPDVVDGLPEAFADLLRAVSDFVDPPLGELTARSVWDPMSRTWQP